MRRSRALEAVLAVERRSKVAVVAAAGIARGLADGRRRNHTAMGRSLRAFSTTGMRSAFTCAAAESHRAMLIALRNSLADRQREAETRVQAARDALLPWAQIRCGLERRRARFAAKPSS